MKLPTGSNRNKVEWLFDHLGEKNNDRPVEGLAIPFILQKTKPLKITYTEFASLTHTYTCLMVCVPIHFLKEMGLEYLAIDIEDKVIGRYTPISLHRLSSHMRDLMTGEHQEGRVDVTTFLEFDFDYDCRRFKQRQGMEAEPMVLHNIPLSIIQGFGDEVEEVFTTQTKEALMEVPFTSSFGEAGMLVPHENAGVGGYRFSGGALGVLGSHVEFLEGGERRGSWDERRAFGFIEGLGDQKTLVTRGRGWLKVVGGHLGAAKVNLTQDGYIY